MEENWWYANAGREREGEREREREREREEKREKREERERKRERERREKREEREREEEEEEEEEETLFTTEFHQSLQIAFHESRSILYTIAFLTSYIYNCILNFLYNE